MTAVKHWTASEIVTLLARVIELVSVAVHGSSTPEAALKLIEDKTEEIKALRAAVDQEVTEKFRPPSGR